MIIFYILLFYVVLGVILFHLDTKKIELTSIFLFVAFIQLGWLVYRLFRIKIGISSIIFLPLLFGFIIIFHIIKKIKIKKTSKIITNFLMLIFKKPFIVIHNTLKTNLLIYKKIIQFCAYKFYPYIYNYKESFILIFFILPYTLMISVLLFETCQSDTFYYVLWLFPSNFFLQQLGYALLFLMYDYFQDSIKKLSILYFDSRVDKEIEIDFCKKQDVLEEKYKLLILEEKFITTLETIISIIKEKLFNIYSFAIISCFILMLLKIYWDLIYLSFFPILAIIFLNFMYFFILKFTEEEKASFDGLKAIIKQKKIITNNLYS